MSASLQPLRLDEFLDWERSQEERYEFDGIQPVAMTGGSRPHSRIGTRLVVALAGAVRPCEVFGPDLKVLTTGRVRYPDASVVCGVAPEDDSDLIEPTVVCEVVSPSTALTDRRVKAIEYAAVPSILAYLVLEQDRPEITVRRRSAAWEAEIVTGVQATLELREIGVRIAMSAIYDAT
jgi:Uma2 family endonuclease